MLPHSVGKWAIGYALDQRLSGLKACAELAWAPTHPNLEIEIARPE